MGKPHIPRCGGLVSHVDSTTMWEIATAVRTTGQDGHPIPTTEAEENEFTAHMR